MLRPYYDHARITIYRGDCREVLPNLTPAPEVVITDPPYGFGLYQTDDARVVLPVLSHLHARSLVVAVFGYPESLAGLCAMTGWTPDEWITWWPTNKPSPRTDRLPRSSEHIAIFGPTPGASRLWRPRPPSQIGITIAEARGLDPYRSRENDVWCDPSPGIGFNSHLRQHPNEKPLTVMTRLIELCSDPGQAILDPFTGSGTTLVAAKALGRKAIGIEIEERYCEIAAKRLAQEVLWLREAAGVAKDPA